MKGERQVGSLRCGEVLERLPDLLDGRLDAAEVARVQEHLRGCDLCERFGGVYQAALAALRAQSAATAGVPAPVLDRLRAALEEGRGI